MFVGMSGEDFIFVTLKDFKGMNRSVSYHLQENNLIKGALFSFGEYILTRREKSASSMITSVSEYTEK